jgi:hypothetical protein
MVSVGGRSPAHTTYWSGRTRISREAYALRCTQLIDNAPELEVLEGALGKILTLGNPLWGQPALDERARNAAGTSLLISHMSSRSKARLR